MPKASSGTQPSNHEIMYESDLQEQVSGAIIDGSVEKISVGVNDSELIVIVDIGGEDAAYTADEARELAQSLKCVSDQRWKSDNDGIVEYIRDLADVVDGFMTADEVVEKWEDRKLDPTL